MLNIDNELNNLIVLLKNNGISRQKAFNDQIGVIQNLKDYGYSRSAIVDALKVNGVNIEIREYDQYTYRARKQTLNYEPRSVNKTNLEIPDSSDIAHWVKEVPFINKTMIDDIVESGFTLNDVRMWNANNIQQLTKSLQQAIQKRKYYGVK